jgi:hypothetical protein
MGLGAKIAGWGEGAESGSVAPRGRLRVRAAPERDPPVEEAHRIKERGCPAGRSDQQRAIGQRERMSIVRRLISGATGPGNPRTGRENRQFLRQKCK